MFCSAASDSEDFGPSLADALPLSGQEARPSPAYSELVDVTAKAFLPASNVLSSLKTITATPRGLACGTSSSSFILGLAVGGRVVFPPLQSVLSPPAGRVCGDTVDSPLQRSDPVLATCQSSTSHSINPDKDAKGSPSWRRVPLLTIRSGYTFKFGEYPPRLDGVQLTVVNSASKASVLQLWLSSLLKKGAIEE